MNTIHKLCAIALFSCVSLAFAMDDDDSSRSSSPLAHQQTKNTEQSEKGKLGFFGLDSNSDDDEPTTNTQQTPRNPSSRASHIFPEKPTLPFPDIMPNPDLPKGVFERQAHMSVIRALGQGHDLQSIGLMMVANQIAVMTQTLAVQLAIFDEMDARDAAEDAAETELLGDVALLFEEKPSSNNNAQSDL